MSDLMDGFSNIYNLTAQINQLKQNGQNSANLGKSNESIDPENTLLEIQKSFSSMLDNLLSSSDEDKDKKTSYDPFSALNAFDQSSISPYLNASNLTQSFLNTTGLDFTI